MIRPSTPALWRIGEEARRRRRCRSDCSSPSARSASCVVASCGSRAPAPASSSSVWPASSARSAGAWIAGPSAIGSENGMPSSITSAPAGGSASRMRERGLGIGIAGRDEGTSAARPGACSSAKRAAMRRHHLLLPDAAATEKTSLSPRPRQADHDQLVLRHLSAQARMTWARACADSSAGMMPSSLQQSWKASSASLVGGREIFHAAHDP